MPRLRRWGAYGLASIVGLILIAIAAIWLISSHKLSAKVEAKAEGLGQATATQLADADRQAHVLGCYDCHGAGLRGKVFLDKPKLARVFAPNLTLIAAGASDQQLAQAIRQGIGADGRPLLIMPSQQYQYLTDAETAALIRAVRAVPKGGSEQPAVALGPVGRVGVVLGKFQTASELVPQYRAAPLPNLGAAFEPGRHLVQTSCSECHGADLKGREVEPGVVSADLGIVGAYDLAQFKTMLRTGIAPGGKKLGLMGSVARNDFSHMTDEEIAAVHAYLAERARRTP